MKDFASALETLIMRDVMYIIGGATVILSSLLLVGTVHNISYLKIVVQIKGFILFIGIGIAYAVGYIVQELSHFFRFTTVHAWTQPKRIMRCVFNFYIREKVEFGPPVIDDPFEFAMDIYKTPEKKLPDKAIAYIQRYINMKHVGITLGTNFFVSTILLVFQWCIAGRLCQGLVLPIVSAILSMALLMFGRIKGLEQFKYMELVYRSTRV